mgnify:CR=1 FL=1
MSTEIFSQRLAGLFLKADNPSEVDVAQADLPDNAAKNVALACQYMLVMRQELNQKEEGHKLFIKLANQAYKLLEEEVQQAVKSLEDGKIASAELNRLISLVDGSLDMDRDCDFNDLPYEHRLLAITTTARFILKYGLRDLNEDELAEMIEDLNQSMLGIEMEAQMMADMAAADGQTADADETLPIRQYLGRLHNVVVLGLKEELQNLKQANL